MDKETHNGWSNYATWRINLELWDDNSWIENIDEKFEDIYALRQYLKDTTEEMLEGETTDASLVLSYALAFLNDVNWHEIAEHIVENHSDIIRESENAI